MPRVVEDSSLYETWKSITASTCIIKKIDHSGNIIDEVIPAGRTFQISPTERRMNQEIAALDELDMFQNGLLSPVKLCETAEDVETLRSNPNFLSETEMTDILRETARKPKEFQERISQITNPITLNRMLELARGDDVNATVRQVDFLASHLEEIAPTPYVEVQTGGSALDAKPGGNPRRMGL